MFQERMSKLSNEDLVSIAYSGLEEGYEEQAILAAKAELSRRNIETKQVDELRDELAQLSDADKNKGSRPLPLPAKVFFLLFGGFFVISAFAIFAMHTRGYKKMVEDALRYALYNLLVLLAISIFISLS